MKKSMSDQLSISDDISAAEVEKFLGRVWGKDCPLAHAENRVDDEDNPSGGALYCAVAEGEKVVGSIALKFLDDKTVELGSLAIDPEYRGRRLVRVLLSWAKEILEKYIKGGFQVVTYATLGSNFMNFVFPKMEDITRFPTYPMNLAHGIGPVNRTLAECNLGDIGRKISHKGQICTSSLGVISTYREAGYQRGTSFRGLDMISEAYSFFGERQIQFNHGRNSTFQVSPFYLAISEVRSIDITEVPALRREGCHLIKVPLVECMNDIHESMSKCMISGFTWDDDVFSVTYSNILPELLQEILRYLEPLAPESHLASWVKLLRRLNFDC